jgi:formylglycine-generating enzyme required for sulfatase activity
MGISGKLNDNADITAPVKSYVPNDFGLYNMAGNVSEWVLDVYRPMTSTDANDFRSFRGNIFKRKELDPDGAPVKDSLGALSYVQVTQEEAANRRNYRRGDVRNYIDGDENSRNGDAADMYKFGVTSLIDDNARVVKGGSWNDRAYYLSPATRRFLDANIGTSELGFRCAMDRIGSPKGNKFKGGNNMKYKPKAAKKKK